MNSATFRIATFNCKNIKRSVEDVRNLCLTCDVICLQETWVLQHDIPYIGTIDSSFGYTATSAVDTSVDIFHGRAYGGVALLYKYSAFQQVSVLECNNPRICAVKIMSNDRPIIVVCVYMPTNSIDNLGEFINCMSAINAIVDEHGVESVFIMGDFNADPGKLFYNELMQICNEQQWSCLDVEILGLDSDTFTFISDVHGTTSWLDHCIATCSAKQSVIGVDVNYNTLWSDHYPLVIECNLILLTPTVSPKINDVNKDIVWGIRSEKLVEVYTKESNNSLKIIDFPPEFVDCADCYCESHDHRQILDKLYSDIVAALRNAALTSRGSTRKGHRGERKVGWNIHVSDAHRVARSRFMEWVMCGKPKFGSVYREMCESRKAFKWRLKWCQNHQEQIKMDALAKKHCKGDFRGFWKDTSKVNIRPSIPVGVDGISDPKDIANVFKTHFAVKSLLGPSKGVHNADVNGLAVKISFLAKDVCKIIRQTAKGKSPGHDGLSVEHLQYAGPHINRVLAMFYSLCVSHSYLPDDLMKTVVVPVVKNKTGDLSDKSNYRPISLATVMAKIFDGLLNAQLCKYITLHDNQFGFRPQLSTESAILCLKHTVKYYTDRKTPVYACFLDLSKAFDLVAYDLLWKKLRRVGLPQELIVMFQYWYTHQSSSVRWAGAMSDSYQLECGVRQGGVSSPTLFNLYIDELIVTLNRQHVGCHVDGVCVNNLSYADDMVLLSASICGIRRLVQTCEEFAGHHGLKYNIVKSQCMTFEVAGTKRPQKVPPVLLYGQPIGMVKQFKYLGHVITSDLRDDADIERERRALSIRANMVARRFVRCSDDVKMTLFRAYCTSLYTCSLWAYYSKKKYSDLRVLYNNAFRMMLGLPRFCSASSMFAVARTDSFNTTIRKRCASMVRRARGSSNTILKMIAARYDCPYIRHCCDRHVTVPMPVRKY